MITAVDSECCLRPRRTEESDTCFGETSIFFRKRTTKKTNRRTRSLSIQSLEDRTPKHASLDLDPTGELRMVAELGGADIEVAQILNRITVTSRESSGSVQMTSFDATNVRSVVFQGSMSADKFTNRTSISDTIRGFGGNDLLVGGHGPSHIEGGEGNDTIRGGQGDDTIDTGDGINRVYAGPGNDTVVAGSGDDYILADDPLGRGGNDVVHGGGGKDYINGGEGNDKLYGNGGADTIYGGPGDDRIDGGTNADKLYGGAGADELYGGIDSSRDRLQGDAGIDKFFQYDDQDVIPKAQAVTLKLSSLYVDETDDGWFSGSHDEVYFEVTANPFSPNASSARLGGRNGTYSLGEGDRISNLDLWRGSIEVGQTTTIKVAIKESDTFGDPTIGEFLIALKNVDGIITRTITPTKHAKLSDTQSITFQDSPEGGPTIYSQYFDATGGDAKYVLEFGHANRALFG